METLSLWIQTLVAVAAVGAAIIALIVSAKDRENAREIAAKDRRANLEQARLMFDLDALARLSRNLERAGHVDQQVAKDMGAEAAALLNVLGPDRLPRTWADKRKGTLTEAATAMDDPDLPDWKRDAIEVALELRRVGERIDALVHGV